MAGGLPGVGLGGLFFVASGLLMPFVELVRVLRGRSRGNRWPWIMRNFFIALAIVVAVWATFVLISEAFGSGQGPVASPRGDNSTVSSTTPKSLVGSISLSVLAGVMSLVLAVPFAQRYLLGLHKRLVKGSRTSG